MSVENTGASTGTGGSFGAHTSSVSLPSVGGTPVTKVTSATSPSGGAISGRAIDVKPHTVSQSDVNALESEEIMSILNSLDAGSVSKVAQAHQTLADTLTSNLTSIRSNAATLQGSWQGSAAQAAMNQFQELHDQTAQLAAQAQQAANVYKWVAEEVIPQYKNLPDPKVESKTQADEQTGSKVGEKVAGGVGSFVGKGVGAAESLFGIGSGVSQAQANETARGYLKSLNSHLITANESLPSPISGTGTRVGTISPTSTGGAGSSSGPSVASAPGLHATAVPVTPGTTGSASSSVSHASASVNGLPQGNGGSPGTLASSSSTATAGPTAPPTSTPPPNPAGPSFVPTPTPVLNSRPGNDEAGPDNTTGPNEDTLTGEDTAGSDMVPIGDTPMGMGMGGVGGAAEDGQVPSDDVMLREANPDLVPETVASNAVIGDEAMTDSGAEEEFFPMEGSGSGGRDERERRRKAWLNDDRDIWGNPISSTPPVLDDGA